MIERGYLFDINLKKLYDEPAQGSHGRKRVCVNLYEGWRSMRYPQRNTEGGWT